MPEAGSFTVRVPSFASASLASPPRRLKAFYTCCENVPTAVWYGTRGAQNPGVPKEAALAKRADVR